MLSDLYVLCLKEICLFGNGFELVVITLVFVSMTN